MIKTNYYTGEMSNNYITEAEAVQNAGFGQYTVQQNTPPMTYGLGGNVYQQQQYYQNPYMNPYTAQPRVYDYSGMRPMQPIQFGNDNWGRNPQQEYTQVYIPPVNPLGIEYMYPANIEEVAQGLINQYLAEKIEYEGRAIAERSRLRREGKYNPYMYNGYNYYNNPMYGTGIGPFQSTVPQQFQQIKQEAREYAINFQMRLSSMCHSYLNDGVTEDQIKEMYTGRYIDVKNTVYEYTANDALIESVSRMVPVDAAAPFRQHFYKVQSEIQKIMPPDTTYKEFGERMSKLYAVWQEEELRDKYREFDTFYDTNSYKTLLKQRCAEKAAQESGFSLLDPTGKQSNFLQLEHQISALETRLNKIKQVKRSMGDDSLTPDQKASLLKNNLNEMGYGLLSDCITIDSDGDIRMSVAAGLEKAKARGLVKDENEISYQEKRAQFAGFLDSIPKSYELDEQKHKQYDNYVRSERDFEFNMTHPPSSTTINSGGG